MEALRGRVFFSLGNTNEISQAFLICALEGAFSLPVHHFLMGEGKREEFLAIGHSSGIDTLLGLWFSLSNRSAYWLY